MKVLRILVLALITVSVFAEDFNYTIINRPDPEEETLKSLRVIVGTNHRYKTDRELPKKDVPSLTYATYFGFQKDLTLTLRYGYFVFERTRKRTYDSTELNASLGYGLRLSENFSFKMDGGYIYREEKQAPDELEVGGNLQYNFLDFWRGIGVRFINYNTLSGGVRFDYVKALDNDYAERPGQRKYVPNATMMLGLPMGLFIMGSYSYDKYIYYEYDDNYQRQEKSENFHSLFFLGELPITFGNFTFKLGMSYTHYYGIDPLYYAPQTARYASLTYYATKTKDFYVTVNFRNVSENGKEEVDQIVDYDETTYQYIYEKVRKDYNPQDYYIGFQVTVILL